MKKLLLVLLIVVLITSFTSCASRTVTDAPVVHSRYTVVIDAGHGGKDCGTIGVDGTLEKDINLSIATMLYDYCRVCGIDSVLVRSGDYEIYKENEKRTRSDLYNRLDYVNSIDRAVLISIHQNYFTSETEWGTQIWYSGNTPLSKTIADGILTFIRENIQPDNKRENKESGSEYYILYKATVPSIMVECGFMSNTKENELLQKADYQKKMAYAILAGICEEV